MSFGYAVFFAVNSLFNIIYTLILVNVFSSWLPFLYENRFFAKLLYIIETLTEPIMNPVRNMLRKTQLGQMPVDFSPVIVLLLIQIVQRVVLSLLAVIL